LSVTVGEWDEALAIAQSSESTERRMALWITGINAFRGELDEARRHLAMAGRDLDRNEMQAVVYHHTLEAIVLLAEGKPAEALRYAEVALEGRSAMGLAQIGDTLHSALLAAFELMDRAKIDELLAIIEQAPPGSLTPELRAIGAHFGARRAALQGDAAVAEAGFSAAAEICREEEVPFELARVLLDHAEWLAGEGRADEAEPLAVEAREIFERLRATPYLERLERLPAPGSLVAE
jgi:hypothetical protein